MELVGFQYVREDKLEANGWPISPELKAKGYVQKDNADGIPRWYVMPNKVLILVEDGKKRTKYDIYKNIMSIYPERKNMSLRLAQEVIIVIMNGTIELTFKNGEPYLIKKEPPKSRKKAKK